MTTHPRRHSAVAAELGVTLQTEKNNLKSSTFKLKKVKTTRI